MKIESIEGLVCAPKREDRLIAILSCWIIFDKDVNDTFQLNPGEFLSWILRVLEFKSREIQDAVLQLPASGHQDALALSLFLQIAVGDLQAIIWNSNFDSIHNEIHIAAAGLALLDVAKPLHVVWSSDNSVCTLGETSVDLLLFLLFPTPGRASARLAARCIVQSSFFSISSPQLASAALFSCGELSPGVIDTTKQLCFRLGTVAFSAVSRSS